MYYDAFLNYVGEFGAYQKKSVLLICIPCIPHALQACSVVFNLLDPPFRCAVPGLANDTHRFQSEAHERLVNASIPIDSDTGDYSQCQVYTVSWNESQQHLSRVGANQTFNCDKWVYDPDYSSSSVVAEWNLVCSDKPFKAHFGLAVLLGLLVGSILGAPLADYFGRKKLLIGSVLLQTLFGIGIAFVSSPLAYLALRLTTSFLGMSTYLAAFVFVAEIVGPRKRTLVGMGVFYTWCAGLFILVLVNFCVQNWRTSQLIISVPCLGLILCWWLLDESPRWLIVKGRREEAKLVIAAIAKANRTQMPDDLQMKSSLESKEKENFKQQKMWIICTSRVLVTRLFILCFGWCTVSMVYFGLTLNMGSLIKGDIYLNFTVQAIQETIAYVVCFLLLERVGRKFIYCASLLLSGLSCLAMIGPVFARTDAHWISMFLMGLGKFGITSGFTLVFYVTAELLPTSVRNSGLGFCSFVGRIASLLSPYIASLGQVMSFDYGSIFPLAVFGTAGVVAGLLALFLPESRNGKLPETIEESK